MSLISCLNDFEIQDLVLYTYHSPILAIQMKNPSTGSNKRTVTPNHAPCRNAIAPFWWTNYNKECFDARMLTERCESLNKKTTLHNTDVYKTCSELLDIKNEAERN